MKKGFTLIELLVVIAIIGILSGTVIVSMSGAQSTAKDSRIKSALGQMRTAAEVFKFGTGEGYYINPTTSNTFETMDQVAKLIAEINIQSTSDADLVLHISDSGEEWCASKTLISDSAKISCIEYTGYTSEGTASCSETTFKCE